MCAPMHSRLLPSIAAFAVLAVAPALAAPKHGGTSAAAKPPAAPMPKELGRFDDWTAASYETNGQTVCYAFTRAKEAAPASGSSAGPLLTVTERSSSRDEVAITATTSYAKDATVTLQVGQTGLDFYTVGRDAFARDGKAAAAAMRRGDQAIIHGHSNTDTYSLKGFTQAYDLIVKTCPAH